MTTASESHIPPLERLKIRLGGYLDGRIDEMDEEIQGVKDWPQSVKLGNNIRRKDQELDSLDRLKREMQRVRAYINSSIEREQQKP